MISEPHSTQNATLFQFRLHAGINLLPRIRMSHMNSVDPACCALTAERMNFECHCAAVNNCICRGISIGSSLEYHGHIDVSNVARK